MDVSLKPVDSTLHRYTNSPKVHINPLNAELNPICHLLALLGAHHILHVSRLRVNAATYCRGPCTGSRSRGGAGKILASACIRCRRISRPSRRQGRTRPDTPDTRTPPDPLAQRTAPHSRKHGSGRGPCHLRKKGKITLQTV